MVLGPAALAERTLRMALARRTLPAATDLPVADVVSVVVVVVADLSSATEKHSWESRLIRYSTCSSCSTYGFVAAAVVDIGGAVVVVVAGTAITAVSAAPRSIVWAGSVRLLQLDLRLQRHS